MSRMRSTYDVARSLYRYAAVREMVHRYGPAYWRLPDVYRGRLLRTAALKKLGGEVTVVGEREHVVPAELEHPPSLGHKIAARRYVTERPYYVVIDNVWLVGKHAAVITRDGQVLLSAFRDEPGMLGLEAHPELEAFLRDGAYRRWPSRPDVELGYSAVNRLDVNYFHWLVETCGQFEILERFAARHRTRPEVFVRAGGPSFQRESLRMLGWPDVVDWPADAEPRAVQRLVIASIPGVKVAVSPSSTQWLRERFTAAASGAARSSSSSAIYLPRRVGGWRYLENDRQVRELLESKGFETLEASSLTFADQVALFAGAKAIAGQHGAALANILFARNASVIEFVGGYGGGEYYSLSSALGHHYRPVVGLPRGDALSVSERDLERVIA